MTLSHKNLPVLSKMDDPILPFYYSSTKNSKLSLNIKDLAENTDVCFDLTYQISQNSKLGISYESLGPFPLTSTQTTENSMNWFPDDNQTFCASNLTKSMGKTFKINFNCDLNDQDNDIVVLKLLNKKEIELDSTLEPELSWLTHWSQAGADLNYSVHNQWSVMYPSSFWTTKDEDIIEFSCELALFH